MGLCSMPSVWCAITTSLLRCVFSHHGAEDLYFFSPRKQRIYCGRLNQEEEAGHQRCRTESYKPSGKALRPKGREKQRKGKQDPSTSWWCPNAIPKSNISPLCMMMAYIGSSWRDVRHSKVNRMDLATRIKALCYKSFATWPGVMEEGRHTHILVSARFSDHHMPNCKCYVFVLRLFRSPSMSNAPAEWHGVPGRAQHLIANERCKYITVHPSHAA